MIRSDQHRFVVRFPLDLHQRLVGQARKAERSLNKEILFRLSHLEFLESEVARLNTVIDGLAGSKSEVNV